MLNLAAEQISALPPFVRFGTSSWTYPGWKGQIYQRSYKSDREFRRRSLEEYAHFPLFRTVGVDSFFYAPPKPDLLAEYASMVPADFRWVSKVWEHLTIPRFPSHPRYGKYAGRENPEFLNHEIMSSKVLAPYDSPEIRAHTGPFVFQFPTIAPGVVSRVDFLARLERFLGNLPKTFQYAVEIRNPEFLIPDYFAALNAHGVTHCFNHWNYMPALKTQMKHAAAAGGLAAPVFVARILTPSGVSYEQAVKLFSPYKEIQRPNIAMREDVVRLVNRGIQRSADTYIIMNNRAEGNSPATIAEIVGMLARKETPS